MMFLELDIIKLIMKTIYHIYDIIFMISYVIMYGQQ